MTVPNPRRRDEILDAAERRFTTQGYLVTSIAELIADTGIAKGTFYHHFPSKEAVMEAVIARQVDRLVGAANAIAERADLEPLERLLLLLGGAGGAVGHAGLAEELERDGNELMHLAALNATTVALTTPLSRILADGAAAGDFDLVDAETTAAALLALSSQLLDADLFGWRRAGDAARLASLLRIVERLLGVAHDTLAALRDRLTGANDDGNGDAGGATPIVAGDDR